MLPAPALLLAWAYGWSVSRAAREPVPVAGGVRIDLVRSAVTSRYVLPVFDTDAVSGLGGTLVVPGTEIKTLAPSAAMWACLGDRWAGYDPNELMVSALARGPVTVPGGYAARVVTPRPGVVTAEVRDGARAVVSSGRLARWGPYGMVDDVRTAADHRRCGLATVVVRSLVDRAAGAGLRTGVLAATADGAFLYRRLGWSGVGEVAGAVRSS